jgi:poly(3-hydroxybutyrate) depolymerase
LTPLLLAFHGGGGTGTQMESSSGLSAAADRRGVLVAYPQGLRQGHGRYAPGWDASGPKDPYADGIDDGLYVSDVLTAIQASYCVDPARIWATGISNGGSMTGYLACVLAGRIAAFAPVEGVFFQIPGGCHPVHPAPILDIHVRTDPVAPFAGVPGRGSPDYFALSIPMWLRTWASRDGCGPDPRQLTGLDGMAREDWTSCPVGVTVAADVLATGGHTWFRAIGAAAGDNLLLTFFTEHPLLPARVHWAPPASPPLRVPADHTVAIHSIRVFRLPEPGAEPFDIVAGPDGSMWFTEFAADKIGRISRSGTITQFTVPTAGAGPYQIAAGAHGTMWFTEYNTTKIGRVSPSGHIAEFQIPRPSYGGTAIIGSGTGPVFAADPAGFIDVISPRGAVRRIKVPSALGLPFGITRLTDGTLWLSELTGYYEYSRHLLSFPAGSGTPSHTLTLADRLSNVVALAAGPGTTAWFADFGAGDIGKVSGNGRVSLFATEPPLGGLSDIAAGPGGAMWFAEQDGIVGRVSVGGHVTELALGSPDSDIDGIAPGRGKSVWVTETGSDAVVEITLA